MSAMEPSPSDSKHGIRLLHSDSLFIDGKWVNPHENASIEIVSPVDGTIVGRVARAGRHDVEMAVVAARRAFDQGPWPRLTLSDRTRMLEQLVIALNARQQELERCWTLQIGALESRAPAAVRRGIASLVHALEVAQNYEFERPVVSSVARNAWVVQEPVGVVAAIVPWNAPFALMMAKVGPALVTGCTVVVKPSPETPLEAYILAECAEQVGLPAGVLNVITADREESAILVADRGVDKVSFTGSTQAGRDIAAACAARIARCTLELGGKSAAIILDDYPVEDAASMLANAIISLTGQVCSMLSRAIVPRKMQDALADAIAQKMADFRIGPPDEPGVDMGPLASRRQLDRVLGYIEGAQREGARLVAGGKQVKGLEKGCFIEPTLFADVKKDMKIAQEEVFGPVLCLMPFDDEEEAIRISNDTIYGLNGAILTHDNAAAYRIARRIRTGKFTQNIFGFDFNLPTGGMKQSGIGREGGEEGLKSFLETKVMLMDAPPPDACGSLQSELS